MQTFVIGGNWRRVVARAVVADNRERTLFAHVANGHEFAVVQRQAFDRLTVELQLQPITGRDFHLHGGSHGDPVRVTIAKHRAAAILHEH